MRAPSPVRRTAPRSVRSRSSGSPWVAAANGAGQGRTMVLSRKGRERAFNGEAIRMPPPGPSARGVSRNPEGAIHEACAWPESRPTDLPGTPPSRAPARPASRESRNCEPAIPEPGAAPAHGPARLSRNAPVPGARTPRGPQLRIHDRRQATGGRRLSGSPLRAGNGASRVRCGATASRRGRRVRWPRGCARPGRRAAGRPCGHRPTRRPRRIPGRRRARGIRG